MKTKIILSFTDRTPFRPFMVRMSSGKLYTFMNPRALGVTKNNSTIVYFDDDGGLALLDVASITEILGA